MKKDVRTIKNILLFMMYFLLFSIIYRFAELLTPLLMAFFFALLLQPVIDKLRKYKFPTWASALVITISTGLILLLILMVFRKTANDMVAHKESLILDTQGKIAAIFDWFTQRFAYSTDQSQILANIRDQISVSKVLDQTSKVAGFLGNITSNFLLMIIYLFAILGSIVNYEQYLKYLHTNTQDGSYQRSLKGFEKLKDSIVTYMKIKFIISLGTGLSVYFVCLIFGLKFSLFWGFQAFLFNFIPTVGSVLATVGPATLGLVELNIGSLAIFIGALISVQFIFGMIIEPKISGQSLSLNTVTILLGLLFWGYILGIIGMLLAVPLTVMLKLLFERDESTAFIGKLMESFSANK